MNVFGKVLVVVVFLLSIGFAVSQMILFDLRDQYRAKYEDESAIRGRVENQLEETRDELARVTGEFDAYRSDKRREIGNLESRIEERGLRISRLERDLEGESAKLAQALTNVEALTARLDAKDGIIEEHEARIASLDESLKGRMDKIEELEETIRRHTVTISDQEKDIARLQEELDHTHTRLQDRKRQLAELEARGVHIDIGKPLPPIDGVLSRVDNEIGVAVLNRGAEHGVEINFDFVVYREANFIARLYVMDVFPEHSLARVDRELTDPRETPLQIGDSVTTRIR